MRRFLQTSPPRRALACFALVLALVAAPWRPVRDAAAARPALEAVTPTTGAVVWLSTAEAPAAATPVAFLHGMCMDARRTCERVLGLGGGALACPTGNGACGGGADWIGDVANKASHLDVGLAAAFSRAGVDPGREVVLVGFSRGAFVARDVAMARPGRYRGLVLVGAAMTPDATRLADAGVRRVVLASGDFDPARRTMERAAAALASAGLPARYVGLGPIGHALPADAPRRLAPLVAWAAGG